MARSGEDEREDETPFRTRDGPVRGYKRAREDADRDEEREANEEDKPEALEDPRHLEEEVGALDFLLGRTPGDVVGEQMGEEGDGEMNTEATEEEEAGWKCQRRYDMKW
jgi:hypothetical protein